MAGAEDTFISDFCNQYATVLPSRSGFVKELWKKDKEDFESNCLTYINENAATLNTWFDPIDPLPAITAKEICGLHQRLFKQLHDKERTSMSEYTSFSYLASLDLYANANQQEDYENCINLDVVEKPNEWTT